MILHPCSLLDNLAGRVPPRWTVKKESKHQQSDATDRLQADLLAPGSLESAVGG